MELEPALLKQLMETFQLELEELLQNIVDGLLILEKNDVDAAVRQSTLDSVFRAAHNIKGAARGVDVQSVADIAHHLENLLSILRKANRRPNHNQVDLCLESLDHMREAMSANMKGESLGFDVDSLLQRLDTLVAQASTAVDEYTEGDMLSTVEAPLPIAGKGSKKTAPRKRASKAKTSVKKSAKPEIRTENTSKVQDTTTPASPSSKDGGATQLESIRVGADKLDRISALAEELQITKIEMDDHFSTVLTVQNNLTQFALAWERSFGQIRSKALALLPADSRQLLTSSLDTIKDLENTVKQSHKHMRGTASNLEFLFTSMRSNVRSLRMMPASSVVNPMARTVRDIARELGKEISFEITGAELEIDRIVLDAIQDPLVHLLRNAIDHGVEDAATRNAAGKPAQGNIYLSLSTDGRQAVIEVADDGAGIDAVRVADIAIKRKIINAAEAEAMSELDLYNLIFHPGFSTKDIITNLSGRGVGLDVVQTNLRKLKGSVAVATVAGKGTTFTLHLPFTLSAEQGLIVRAGGCEMAIPLTSLERVMELTPDKIINVEASQAVMINDNPVPVRDLASVLGLATTQAPRVESIPLIVVSRGWRSVALVVESIIGEQEIVIKALRPPLFSVNNIAGATVTSTGDIIMVLNAGDLVESALSTDVRLRSAFAEDNEADIRQPQILVVDDSITTRTLERGILEACGYAVTLANDGKEGWETLQTQKFDLVVTDVEMPVMNGFELTTRIKKSKKYRDTPVIIVTSLATDDDKQHGIDAGADAYIVKSQFETKALIDIAQQLI